MEQPTGTGLTSGVSSIGYGPAAVGSSSAAKTFAITNIGPGALTITTVSTTGGNADEFTVNTTGMLTSVPASGSTTFSVTFTPTAADNRTTTLRILNDDADEGIFDITLSGVGFYTQTQYDANRAAGQNDVVNSPNTYSLYNQTQYAANGAAQLAAGITTGQNNVINAPNTYSLFTLSQVQALNVGVPLLTKDPGTGTFKLTIGVQKTPDLAQPFTDFPMTGAGFTTGINAQGKLEFQFTVPGNAAFFRLQSQ